MWTELAISFLRLNYLTNRLRAALSLRLGVLFLSPSFLDVLRFANYTVYKGHISSCMEYPSCVTALLNRGVKSYALHQLPFFNCLSLSSHSLLQCCIHFYSFHYFHALLNLFTACIHPSHGSATPYSFISSSCCKSLQLYSSFICFTGKLWKSFYNCFLLYMRCSFEKGVSRHI